MMCACVCAWCGRLQEGGLLLSVAPEAIFTPRICRQHPDARVQEAFSRERIPDDEVVRSVVGKCFTCDSPVQPWLSSDAHTFTAFMASDTLSFVHVRFMACSEHRSNSSTRTHPEDLTYMHTRKRGWMTIHNSRRAFTGRFRYHSARLPPPPPCPQKWKKI